MTYPGDPLANVTFWLDPVLTQAHHLGLLMGSYHATEQKLQRNDFSFEKLEAAFKAGFEQGGAPTTPPPPHSAYSSHLNGKEELMASHGLPTK